MRGIMVAVSPAKPAYPVPTLRVDRGQAMGFAP